MERFKIIIYFTFILSAFSCNKSKLKHGLIIRTWSNNLNDSIIVEKTTDIYYDFIIKKSYFSDSIFNELYRMNNYSKVLINGTNYHVFKKDEFFINPNLKGIKVGIIDNLYSTYDSRAYYLLERYGIVTIFIPKQKMVLELKSIIIDNDTSIIDSLNPLLNNKLNKP
ncbi:MAG: hypothetical protein K1X82_01615 [Bacteroidia bacterium]|nr:hypothetical protein [Bacteroidia bacterium]